MSRADNAATTHTVFFDRVAANGTLTPKVLETTVPTLGIGHSSLRTVAPNTHVLVTPKWISGQTASSELVTVVGCH